MKWFSSLAAALVLAAAPLAFAGPDDEYIGIYQLIEEADRAASNNDTTVARNKFAGAQDALAKFKKSYPLWNDKAVDFRLQYVTEKLAKLASAKTAAPAPAAAKTPATPADPLAEMRQAIAQLQQERNVLNAKLTEALSAQPAAIDPRELQKAEAQITALQKEKELLRVALEQEQAKSAKAVDNNQAQQEIASLRSQLAAGAAPMTAMERELKTAREAAAANAAALANLQAEVKRLKDENVTLLARAKPAEEPKPKATGKKADETNRELATLRARIEALEAKKVPFTAEELALLKGGPTALKPAPTKAESKRKELPAGAGYILNEAQRAFVAGRFEEAEAKYREVLKMDENNVHSLANMGLIQLEMGRLNDAEATLKKALALDPDNGFALSNLGILRFKQDKIDEAVDALSRAAELEPKNPITQNYLGISLASKGLPGPAEAALRKSIELQPRYGAAHHNLAVIYVDQKYLELARYHYNKSIEAGYAPDPELEKSLKGPAAK
jgi:Flp pilus assembly protein TadD